MRSTAYTSTYAARALVKRTLVWGTFKDRDTGDLTSIGFWDDLGTVSITVLAGLTLSPVSRTYVGSGSLINVGRLPLTSDVSVRTIDVSLSQIDETVAIAVRGYDARNAPIEIHELMLDPATRSPVSAAEPLFVGYVDTLKITTPAEGQDGSIDLTCVSHTRDLTRSNPAVRSRPDQILRSATDTFFADTGAVGDWEITWGRESRKLGPRRPRRPRD